MPIDQFQQLRPQNICSTSKTICGVSGNSLPVKGEANVEVKDFNSTQPTTLNFVITERGPAVFGLDGLRALRVNVVFHVPRQLPSSITALIHKCGQNSGCMNIEPIKLEVTCQPIFKKARPVPFGLRIAVQNNIDDFVAKGILQPVQPSTWATPIVTLLKTDLGSVATSGSQLTLISSNLPTQPERSKTCSKDWPALKYFQKLISQMPSFKYSSTTNQKK